MKETIQQLKEEIALLQQKLLALEEKEPDMTLKKSGECDIVSYDHKYYYRLSFGVGDYYWYKRYIGSSNLMKVEDPEEHRLVEELYEGVILDTGGVVEEQGTWKYDPDAKFRKQEEVKKLQEKEWKVDVKTDLKPNWEPKPQTPEETEKGLRNAMRTAKKEGVFDTTKESWMDKPIDELVAILEKNPPECLKFQLGKTLEQLIERWWCDVFSGPHENWTMEECISDLCDRIFLWLPKEQDSSGTQRIETIVAVDTHNELLRKIKSKIHNKKDT